MEFFELVNTWVLIRLFGLLAYLFFTLSVIFGMLGQFAFFKHKKAILFQVHLSSAWAGLVTVLVHMLLLLIDSYQPYGLGEILIPFAASYSPILSGIGTIAFLLFLIVIFTSDVMMKVLGRPLWKKIHTLVFPSWLGMVVHGLFLGTDSANIGVYSFYMASIIIVMAVLLLALLNEQNKKTAQQKDRTSAKLQSIRKG